MEFIDIPTPSIPVPGQGVTADRGAGDARAMRALRIIPGRGISATATPDGVVVSATGARRSASVPADVPQWKVSATESGVHVDGGRVWIFDAALEAGDNPEISASASEHVLPGADLGTPRSGAVVWRYSEGGGGISWGDETGDESIYEVVLAEVSVDEETGAVAVRQRHVDTVFFLAPTDAEDAPPDQADECGNPLNGVDDDSHPLNGQGHADGGGGGRDENPLDHEGEGGYTPTCKEP